MEGGREVNFRVKIEGSGWTWVPDSIPDDKVIEYINDSKVVVGGNKLLCYDIEASEVEAKLYNY
jgi:hypothetical protein